MLHFLTRLFGEDEAERSIHDEEVQVFRERAYNAALTQDARTTSTWVQRALDNDLPTFDTTNGADAYRSTRS